MASHAALDPEQLSVQEKITKARSVSRATAIYRRAVASQAGAAIGLGFTIALLLHYAHRVAPRVVSEPSLGRADTLALFAVWGGVAVTLMVVARLWNDPSSAARALALQSLALIVGVAASLTGAIAAATAFRASSKDLAGILIIAFLLLVTLAVASDAAASASDLSAIMRAYDADRIRAGLEARARWFGLSSPSWPWWQVVAVGLVCPSLVAAVIAVVQGPGHPNTVRTILLMVLTICSTLMLALVTVRSVLAADAFGKVIGIGGWLSVALAATLVAFTDVGAASGGVMALRLAPLVLLPVGLLWPLNHWWAREFVASIHDELSEAVPS